MRRLRRLAASAWTLAALTLLVASSLSGATLRASVGAVQIGGEPDLAGAFPAEVEVAPLVVGQAESGPDAPARLTLDRLLLAPGSVTALLAAPGPELLWVEAGSVVIVDELGIEGAYGQGAGLAIGAGVSYGLRNDGAEDAALLRLRLVAAEASPAEGDGVVAAPILAADLADPPSYSASLFLARTVWPAGADAGRRAFTGPVGFVGEEGDLSVAGASGIEGPLAAGRGVVFPAGALHRERNLGAEPAVALVAGVVPAGAPLLAPPPETPTPTITPTSSTEETRLDPTAPAAPGGAAAATASNEGLALIANLIDQRAEETPHPAHIHEGTCANLDPTPLFSLANIVIPDGGPRQAADETIPAGQSTTQVEVDLSDILASEHAINVHRSNEEPNSYIACGAIGGAPDDNGDLFIGLTEQDDAGYTGVAWLHDNGDGTTNVSVILFRATDDR